MYLLTYTVVCISAYFIIYYEFIRLQLEQRDAGVKVPGFVILIPTVRRKKQETFHFRGWTKHGSHRGIKSSDTNIEAVCCFFFFIRVRGHVRGCDGCTRCHTTDWTPSYLVDFPYTLFVLVNYKTHNYFVWLTKPVLLIARTFSLLCHTGSFSVCVNHMLLRYRCWGDHSQSCCCWRDILLGLVRGWAWTSHHWEPPQRRGLYLYFLILLSYISLYIFILEF